MRVIKASSYLKIKFLCLNCNKCFELSKARTIVLLTMNEDFNNLPKDVKVKDNWDTSALRALVDARCHEGRKPSHLFLGRHESQLLRGHLGDAFGDEAVSTFNDLYYMGMLVVELSTDSCVRVAGEKFMDKLEKSGFELKDWKDNDFSEWDLHFS